MTFAPESLKIICNSMVRNHTLLERILPNVLVFADPVFHFSPSRYDEAFREHARQTILKYDCFCIVPERQYGLMLAHFPELAHRLIGMPVKTSQAWNFPTPDNLFVRATANIMTLFMVPLAASLSREVNILGADGRQNNEKYFWKHSAKNQFDQLMQSVEDTHPSFFRDRIYSDYYEEHCVQVESLIREGEKVGVRFHSLTPSYIPALSARQKTPANSDDSELRLT
jgi:hypothetical protein